MDFLFALFIAGGVGAFAYTKLGKRAGYGNTQNVFTIVIVSFVLALIIAYTMFKFILHIS